MWVESCEEFKELWELPGNFGKRQGINVRLPGNYGNCLGIGEVLLRN